MDDILILGHIEMDKFIKKHGYPYTIFDIECPMCGSTETNYIPFGMGWIHCNSCDEEFKESI